MQKPKQTNPKTYGTKDGTTRNKKQEMEEIILSME